MAVLTTDTPRCRDITHRSYTGDSTFDKCQFLAHALDDGLVPFRGSDKMAVGSAVDLAVKAAVLGRDFHIGGLVEDAFVELNVPYRDKVPAAIEKAERLFDLWDREVRPVWGNLYAVELELHFEVYGVPQHVHLDAVDEWGIPIDLKTSEQRLDRTGIGRAEVDEQMTRYAYALWKVYGQEPSRVILDGLIDAQMPKDEAIARGLESRDGKRQKPWWDRRVARRDMAHLQSFEDSVLRREQAREDAARSGVYQTQGRASQYACTGCAAISVCPAWRGWEQVQPVAADSAAA